MANRSDMTTVTWGHLGEMEPMAGLARTLRGPLAVHNAKFVKDRRKRMEKVSKMTLDQQCEHYRSLGFYKGGLR